MPLEGPTSSLPRTCPACGTPHKGDNRLAPLAWEAHRRARELGGLPAGSVVAAAPFNLTRYTDGKRNATSGRLWLGSLQDLERELVAYSQRVVAKGAGDFFVEANLKGATAGKARRRDNAKLSDVLEWTARTLDSDGVPDGDWHVLVEAVRRAGLGVLFQRSSSHAPATPKWHATIPFARGVAEPDVDEWRRQDAWLCGWFSAMAGQRGTGKDYGSAGKETPACGLDLRSKSGNRGTPVFPAARRSDAAMAPETFATPGGSLDLEGLLRASGYHEARALWLDLEEHDRARKRPIQTTKAPAGAPEASLANLPPDQLDAAVAWAARHGLTFAASRDRNAAALAIGGALGRRGVGADVAYDVVEALSVAGGLSDAGDRARVARYSCENARAGKATKGLPALREILHGAGEDGEALVDDLSELIDALAPDTAAIGSAPPETARPTRPVVSAEEANTWTREALDARGRASLDRRGTGVGKSHGLCEVLCDIFSTPDPAPVVIAVGSHQAAKEFDVLAGEVARTRGQRLPLAVVPRLAQRQKDGTMGDGFPCLAGLADEYWDAAKRGWNPVAAVCHGCEHYPVSKNESVRVAEPCGYHLAVREAWGAPIVVAQKKHVSMPGYWQGRGERFPRLVIEEDASDALVRSFRLTRSSLADFVLVLRQAENWVQQDMRHAVRGRDREELLTRAIPLATAQGSIRALQLAIEGVQVPTDVAVPVELRLDRVQAEDLLRSWTCGDDHGVRLGGPKDGSPETTLLRAAQHLLKTVRVRARNLLPLLLGIARASLAGQPLVGLATANDKGREVYVDLRQRPPAEVATLVLDATGDAEVLEADLGRPVDVLEGRTDREARVVQLRDHLWSRTWFGLVSRPGDEDAPRLDPERVTGTAQLIAELVRRTRSVTVGLVTYAALEEPLLAAIKAVLPVRPRWGGLQRTRVTVHTMHFGACRGSNEFKKAGCDLVVVVGTPEVPPSEVMRRRLRLGPATPEELSSARSWVEVDGVHFFGWQNASMARAWASLVAAELAQAIGRGARGDWSPRAGTWVLSSCPIDEWVPDQVRRLTSHEACLDAEAARDWDAAVRAGPAGWRTIQAKTGAGKKVAERIAQLVRDGLFDRPGALDQRGNDGWAEDQPAAGVASLPGGPAPIHLVYGDPGHLGAAPECRSPVQSPPQTERLMRELLEVTGWSERELAAHLCIAPSSVHRYVTGSRTPPPEILARASVLLERHIAKHGRVLAPGAVSRNNTPQSDRSQGRREILDDSSHAEISGPAQDPGVQVCSGSPADPDTLSAAPIPVVNQLSFWLAPADPQDH